MSMIEDRIALLDTLHLESGAHQSWEQGACVMEAVAYIAGEPFSDHPKCASPILTSFLIGWNDALPDDERQILKPYIPKIVGTNTGKADEQTRAWMLTDWLARECAPAWLREAGLVDRDAARAAARDAAWDAAWDAARAAARDAAWAAARDAAWDAAWDAARDAARAAARDAADKGGSYDDQYKAAYAAAKPLVDAKFAPTVKGLQTSTLQLLDRLIAVGKEAA